MTRRPLVTPRNDSPAIVEAERAVGRMVIELAGIVDSLENVAEAKEAIDRHVVDAVLWAADMKRAEAGFALVRALFGVEP